MSTPEYVMRIVDRPYLDRMISWAASEGWNPGLYDAESFYAADPQGFWMGFLDDKPIASLSAVKYGNKFAFIGYYIVQPEYRGRGFGLQLWQNVLASVEDRNLALDGVIAQQKKYQKSGFRIAHRNIRYQGVGNEASSDSPGVVTLSELPLEMVMAYDRPFFPGDRTQFIKAWIQHPESTALGIVDNGNLVAYGVVRPSHTGYRIGPFFADREEWAEILFLALKSRVKPGSPFFLDVVECNPKAIALVERHEMSPGFETARMYTREIPDLPYDRYFGVATLEVG